MEYIMVINLYFDTIIYIECRIVIDLAYDIEI